MPTEFAEAQETAQPGFGFALRRVALRWMSALGVVAWSSLIFAMLQSVCTFFAAMDGLRTAIGIGSLVLAKDTAKIIDRFHADWLRVPMIGIAVAGAVLNLLVLWRVRRLRNKPAAQWRQRPVSAGKLRMEWVQIGMAVVTLVLVAVEERQHLIWLKHL